MSDVQASLAEASDEALARRISGSAAGSAAAEEAELYRRFAPRVRMYGRRHLRDDAAAQDLAQEVLLTAIERLRGGAVRAPGEIGSFILSTARLTATARRRTDYRRAQLGQQVPVHDTVAADVAITIDLPQMARCLGALDGHARRIIILTYYAERTAAQIAAELGATGGAVRVARHRAMERLRDCMGVRSAS